LVVADRPAVANAVLAQLRVDLAEQLGLIAEDAEELCWIVDWPMFEFNEEAGRWDPLHHPFTGPAGELDPENPGEARALAYDLVWNGQEMGGGSIRISDPELQLKALGVLGIDEAEARERFGFLLEAFRYGAPPHGGIAYGLDRIVQRLLRAESIRDVIAFPKAASGADPLTGAPAPVDEEQLRDLGLALRTAPRARA
jgi:aspartyl-tRNA synthetase